MAIEKPPIAQLPTLVLVNCLRTSTVAPCDPVQLMRQAVGQQYKPQLARDQAPQISNFSWRRLSH